MSTVWSVNIVSRDATHPLGIFGQHSIAAFVAARTATHVAMAGDRNGNPASRAVVDAFIEGNYCTCLTLFNQMYDPDVLGMIRFEIVEVEVVETLNKCDEKDDTVAIITNYRAKKEQL